MNYYFVYLDTDNVYNDMGPDTAGDCSFMSNEVIRSRNECFYKCENLPSCLGVAIKEGNSGHLTCYFFNCNTAKNFTLENVKDVRFYSKAMTSK